MNENSVYSTTNVALATVLSSLGVPWANPDQPALNYFDEDYLREKKVKTIKEAMARGFPGRVVFTFFRSDDIDVIIKAFDEQQESESVPELPEISVEIMAKVFTMILKNRVICADMHKKLRKYALLQGRRRVLKDRESNSATVNIKGIKFLPVDASKEIRDHLRV